MVKALNTYGGLIITGILVLAMLLSAPSQGENTFALLVTGLALGSLYAIVALGYTMVYGIIELINFAHGDVFGFGAFLSFALLTWLFPGMTNFGNFTDGLNTIHIFGTTFRMDVLPLVILVVGVTMILSALIAGILGVLIERIAYRPLRNAPRLAPLITAIGVSFIIENALLQWKGGILLQYPSIMPVTTMSAFGATIRNIEIVVIISAVVLMLLLDRFVNQTKMGKAMRAVAQDREAALMMGINVDRIIALTFFVGSALAGAGAVIYGIYLGGIVSTMGFSLGLFAFTAAVLGGIGNIRGAMLGGLLIGIIKRYVDGLGAGQGTEWADIVVFLLLILVLLFRPTGLLGSQVPEKV